MGRHFGRYQLQELVAVSGMGVVYRAWDPKLQCLDAIKLVSEDKIPDEAARRQLEQEARIAISLDHPNICRIKNFVDEPSQAGIVMEFVEGQVLTSVIPEGVGLPFELVLAYGIEIARAVSCAHEHGVIHRDLKSGNVIVTRDGHIKLLDFGLSTIQGRTEIPSAIETLDTNHSSDAIAGTPAYWPPEVLRRCPSDVRGDIWSFGVLLYEMASGQMPFRGATIIELGASILHEAPLPPPGHVPESLSKIIERCLRKEVDQRYQQVSEIRAALEAIEPGRSFQPGQVPSDLEIDPQAALPYAGLAYWQLLMGAGEYGLRSPTEIMPKAKEAALKALSIDDSNAEAHLSLAMVKFRFDWEWEEAEKEFKRAIELNRGDFAVHSGKLLDTRYRYWYSVYLAVLGRSDEAFVEAKTARQLSPLSPAMHFGLGLLLYASGQNEEAIEQLRDTIAMDARFPLPHLVLGLTFARKGRFDEAIAELKQALTIGGARPLWSGFLGQVYASAGRTEDAVEILHELQAASRSRYVPPTAFAVVCAGLGMIQEAFLWLDRAVTQRDGLLIYLKVGSIFDRLRPDQRFREIVERVGLQEDPSLLHTSQGCPR